jgi:hypothetical protein
MRHDEIPLFSSWESYAKSLPVREFVVPPGILIEPLYKFPYWANEKDLADRLIEHPQRLVRGLVRYLAAPSAYGKTCSILPAFLYSAEQRLESNKGIGFTHYLHLSFNNNGGNHFVARGEISNYDLDARQQGAAFMLNCLKHLLDATKLDETYIVIDKKPFSIERTVKDVKTLFSLFGQSNILVHLDEHRSMCRPESDAVNYSQFRKGALQVLAKVDGVTPIATYTGMPQLPPEQYSQVCRYPLPVPPLDLDLVTKDIKELKLPAYDKDNRVQRKTWSTLRLRLCLKIRQMNYLHFLEERNQSFLQDFKKAASGQVVQKAIIDCINLCPFHILKKHCYDENALKLLIGIQETELEREVERQIQTLFVVGNLVTSSLEHLLSCADPKYPIYSLGRNRLRTVLTSPKTIEFNSQTPLEAAYTWVLSCLSAVGGVLDIGPESWEIKCKNLKQGRLFEGDDITNYVENFKNMVCDTIYYVVEEKGETTHPCCDIFFCTKNNELVLIDVTSGGENLVKKKLINLSSWVAEAEKAGKLPNVTYHGVVLAPLCESTVVSTSTTVNAVCSGVARDFLGGLQQML